MSLLDHPPIYRPMSYPWAFEAWKTQQQIHWIVDEIPMGEDVADWQNRLTDGEKNLLTQIFRFFTQADVDVNGAYMKHYSQVFQPTEVLMMLAAFSNIETIHVHAYSHLLDTMGMPETEYSAFMEYEQMRAKHDYFQTFNVSSKRDIAKTLAAFGAFTEGMQLFASFAILLNFPRHNRLRGMGQVIAWSSRDETLHCLSIIRLFRTFIEENPEVWDDALRSEIYDICHTTVSHEDAFIDLAFEQGPVYGLTPDQVKNYIRFIADRRLTQLGLEERYGIERNPLPWIDDMLNAVEHSNFFEARSTEYSRASTQGTWEEAFEAGVFS